MLVWKTFSYLRKARTPTPEIPPTAQRERNCETEEQPTQVKSQVTARSLPSARHFLDRTPRKQSSNSTMSHPNVTDMDAEISRTPILVSTENTPDKDQDNSASEIGAARFSSPIFNGHVLNEYQDGIIQEALSSDDDDNDVPRKRLCTHCKVPVPTDLWDTRIETAMHQQRLPATVTASNRMPPAGIVMPNLSLMVSPDRRKRAPPRHLQKRALQLGVVMPDLSSDVHSDQQQSVEVATDADKSPVTEVIGNPATRTTFPQSTTTCSMPRWLSSSFHAQVVI